MKPCVSVIIPTYNRCTILSRSIQSVFNQSFTDFECIVVDDGSNDHTAVLIDSFDDDRLIYFRHENNRGASAARNTGIRNAKGDLIAFLDDDDEWLPTKLEKQIPLLQSLHQSYGLVYCWMDYYDDKENVIYEHHPKYKGYVFPQVLDAQRLGGCPTLLVRRDVFARVGFFDESLPRGNDGDFIRRVCQKYEVDYVPEVLVYVYSSHSIGQISDNNPKGINNHIISQLVKLRKFEDVLERFPKERGNVFLSLAQSYRQLNDLQNCLYYYFKAFGSYPFSRKYLLSFFYDLTLLIYSQFK